MTATAFEHLQQALKQQQGLAFALLVGSRATGTERPDSDWDIAIAWLPEVDGYRALGDTESLRRRLARALNLPETAIDLIDLRRANLAMRASVADEGRPLLIVDELGWARFLKRTWRDLEDFERERHLRES